LQYFILWRRFGSRWHKEEAMSIYPHPKMMHTFTEMQALSIFLRDSFIDRYSGSRLLFPQVLRVLSLALRGTMSVTLLHPLRYAIRGRSD
jgi:hypothetical protein